MFASFAEDERASRSASDRNNGATDFPSNVTEQFKFMHVSANREHHERHVQELANSFMTTLGINENNPEYSAQLEKLSRQLSGMVMQQPSSHSQPQLHGSQTSSSTSNNVSFAAQNPTISEKSSSKSPKKNESLRGRFQGRRHAGRNRSRSPMARFAKAAASSFRSLSPRRRNNERAKSPLATQENSNVDTNMATDNEFDEFFEAHSTLDSFTFDSPKPKHASKPSSESGNTAQKQHSAPSDNGRPPLATVNLSELSPQNQSTTFKFDKEHDKFNLGTSPPKKSKLGSPVKVSRSPTNRSSPPSTQPNIRFNDTPLQGSPLTEGGTPFLTSVKKPQSNPSGAPAPFASPLPEIPNTKPQINVPNGQAPFASPVPDIFHAPETFIRSSGSRGIPTPQNILHNDQQSDAATRRQTAPPTMSTAAATAAASFRTSSSTIPNTPFDPQATGIPTTVPDTSDTAETLIKKKTRNTSTPNLGPAASGPQFNVDLSHNPNVKGKGKRGNTLRKGFGSGRASTKTTDRSSFAFGMDDIKENKTDDTAPTDVESPSTASPVAMDTSPILSPPPQHSQQESKTEGINAPAQFSLGVGGSKGRSRRKEVQRRGQVQRNLPGTVIGPSRSTFDLNHVQDLHEAKLANIRADVAALKDLGKACYLDAKYQESTRVFSQAIEKFKFELFGHVAAKDLLAVLLSNRAAALLMIGAYESAAEDCRNGLLYVTDPRNTSMTALAPDQNPSLRPKLYTRMGKSLLRLGKLDDADNAFSEAVSSANAIQDFHQRHNVVGMHDGLEHIKMDAMMGQTDVAMLRKLFKKINVLEEQKKGKTRNPRDRAMECLGIVKVALNTANGCHDLHLKKVDLLAELHRWREVGTHCERFATSNVKYDGCLIGDLSSKNPFPGVPVAKYLRADYFDDANEEDIKGIERILDKKPAAEAILRLPYSMMPYYLKSLRLNERYFVEEECLLKLDRYITERIETTRNRDFVISHFLWLAEERAKMQRTKIERGIADDLFTNGEYRQAALRYAECLTIDSGGIQNSTGCRFHAVLHCNRAACFMMLKKYKDAMTECTAALRIYPRYVKALLRRARCYSRLDRTREAENDFNHWLDMVKQAKNGKYNPVLSDLVFDGPHTVKEKEIENVKAELNDVLEAKAKAENDEFLRQARKNYEEQSRKYNSERFHYNSKKSPSHEEAHKRREHFYSSQNTSRRWDSFKDRSTHSGRQEKPKAQKNRKDEYGYKSKSSPGGYKSQGSPRETDDHYTVLGIDRRATTEEIKKAYKKMALKHHPDKNKDNPKAADNFLRIKDAYETLKDSNARRKYDSQSRRRRY